MTVLTPLLLATTVFAGGVQVKIQMLTASEAALGAPVAYNFTVTNGDTVKHNLTSTVTMTAPDGTTYNVYTSNLQGYPPGNSVTYTPNSLTTSSYTSQTGTFTLTANASELGTLRGSNSIMFTVVPAPASGYYVSVGGAGPDPALLGMKYDFQAVTANLTGATQTLTTKYTLLYPDGTQTVFVKSTTNTLTAGASAINKGSVTTTQWTGTTGTFGVRADVFNGSSLVATSTQTITRNALAATAYPPTFTDATAATGVNHPNMMGMACTNGMMMMMGQGVAVGDYDNDGWDDMYVTDGMGMGFLWHNNGVDANGNFLGFTDMSMEAMIPMVMNAAAANFVDYDNDGNPDLLILTTDSMNVLLHNDGNGMFSDVSDTVGLPFRSYGDTFSSAATWGDYDGDGYPDLYITAWGDCMKMNKQDHLYHNEHGTGFTDVSNLLNNTGPQLSRPGLAAVFFDYNGDGRVDLFVGNDAGGPSVLWKNNGLGSDGKWSFTDVSATARANTAISSMGIAIGDYNRDGLFDVFQTNAGYNNLLQQKAGNAFTQVQTAANVGRNSANRRSFI
jgi:hypothetical protein